MKAAFTLSLLIIIYLLSSISLPAADSGWNDSSYFKYEKLIITGLQAVQFSDDGTKFYTYNSDSTIRIWNTATGILLDSILLDEKPTKLFFSTDGKTAGYYIMLKDIENYPSSRLYKYIIYDISLKKELAHSIFNIASIISPGDTFLFFSPYSLIVIDLDYSYTTKKLYISYGVNTIYRSSGPYITNFSSGASGLFNLINDSIILENRISNMQANAKYIIGDFIYYTTDHSAYTQKESGAYWSSNIQSRTFKYNINEHNNYQILMYEYSETYKKDVLGDHYQNSGHYEHLSNIYCDQYNSLLLVKSDSGFYYYNLLKDTITDTLRLLYANGIEQITNNLKFLVSLEKNQLYFYDILSKILIDTLDCPIIADNFILMASNNDILAFNNKGEIILLKSKISTGHIDFQTLKNWYYIGDTVKFNNLSSVTGKRILWKFGDGDTSNILNPIHIYTKKGTYTVSLQITDQKDSNYYLEKKEYIEILTPLKADFTVSDSLGDSPLTVNFANLSTGDIIYTKWDFGDGDTSNNINPQHVYKNSGHYGVTLTIADKYRDTNIVKHELIKVDNIKYDSLIDSNSYKIMDWDKDGFFVSCSGCSTYNITIKNIVGSSNLNNSSYFFVSALYSFKYILYPPSDNKNIPVYPLYYLNGIDSAVSPNGKYHQANIPFISSYKLPEYNNYNYVYLYIPNNKIIKIDYNKNLHSTQTLTSPCTAFNIYNNLSYVGSDNIVRKYINDTVLIDSIKISGTPNYIFPLSDSTLLTIINRNNKLYLDEFTSSIIPSEKELLSGKDSVVLTEIIQQKSRNGFIGIGYIKNGSFTSGYMVSFDNHGNIFIESINDDFTSFQNITLINGGLFLVTGNSKYPGFIILDSNITRIRDYRYFTLIPTYKYFGAVKLNDNQFILEGKYTENGSFDRVSLIKVEIPDIFTSVADSNNIEPEQSLSLFPNPSENLLNISLKTSDVETGVETGLRPVSTQVKICDVLGNTRNEFSYPIISNKTIISIDINNLEQGIYFVKVILNNKVLVGKFVKN
jgi:PKD repeat protein